MSEPEITIGPQTENYSSRPPGVTIQYFIVHSIAEAVLFRADPVKPAEKIPALEWLTENVPGRPRLSAHWIIYPDGAIVEIANPIVKAWHVGTSEWEGVDDLNRFSVGAELVVKGAIGWDSFADKTKAGDPFTPEQYYSTGWLVASNMRKRPISLGNVRGHDEVSGVRVRPDSPKIDPGPHFNWRKLYGHIGVFLHRN